MKAPSIPADENARSQALHDLEIIYTPAEERFDRITRLARRVFDAPIALISLVTRDKQWFKSCQGLTASETSREISFCGHAILSDEIFVVANALKDPDFKDNPLVTGAPNIRFYAGQPLHFNTHRLGTLCLIDTRPRQLKPQDYDSLKCLAGWVELELLSWRNEESSFLHQVLQKEDRAELLDPVTGDLNEEGVSLLKEKIEQTELEQDEALQIRIKIENMPENIEQDAIDLLRKSVAQSVRSIVNDKGILGQEGEDGFTVICTKLNREQANIVVEELRQKTDAFIEKEFELSFIKPEVSFQLAPLDAAVEKTEVVN